MMPSIWGQATTGRKTARGAIPAKPALQVPLQESTMSVPYWWNTVLLVHTSQEAEHLGPVVNRREQPGRRHCRCRRRARPRKGREEVRGVRLLLLLFLFLLDDEEEAASPSLRSLVILLVCWSERPARGVSDTKRSSCIDCQLPPPLLLLLLLQKKSLAQEEGDGGGVHVVAGSQRRHHQERSLPRGVPHSAVTPLRPGVEETARPHPWRWRLLCP